MWCQVFTSACVNMSRNEWLETLEGTLGLPFIFLTCVEMCWLCFPAHFKGFLSLLFLFQRNQADDHLFIQSDLKTCSEVSKGRNCVSQYFFFLYIFFEWAHSYKGCGVCCVTRSDKSKGAKGNLTKGAVMKCTSLGKLQIQEEQLAKHPPQWLWMQGNDLFAQVDLE